MFLQIFTILKPFPGNGAKNFDVLRLMQTNRANRTLIGMYPKRDLLGCVWKRLSFKFINRVIPLVRTNTLLGKYT